MKKSFIILFSIIIAYSGTASTHAENLSDKITTQYPQQNNLQDKLFGLSKIWSEMKYNFVNIDRISFDLDSLYYTTIPKIIETTNDIEYYDELQRFMASVNDGHTELIDRPYSWNDYNDYIPATLVDINGEIYFSDIKKQSGIDSTLIGAKIIEIEGLPVKEYINHYIYPNISASTDNHKWFQSIIKIQGGKKGSYFRGRAKKLNGNITSFSILRNGETTRTPNDSYWSWSKNKQKFSKEGISLEWNNNIAILNIKAFWPETINLKIDSFALLINDKAKGLIIDLRSNGGGSTNVAEHLQMYLSKTESFLTFGSQTRINDGYGRSQGNYRNEYQDFYLGRAYQTEKPDTVVVDKKIEPFKCPIIILIGKYTFSAAEDFLVNIYEIPDRPLLIGEPTGGSTGAPLIVKLPHEAVARICALRILFPYSHKPFIEKGIHPDILIKQSISDYIDGKDRVLERAIEYLHNRE